MRYPISKYPWNISLRYGDPSPVERAHSGTDYVYTSEPVFAVTEGEVLFSGTDKGFERRGAGVKIIHPWHDGGWEFVARYWHLIHIKVKNGKRVSEGQLLGFTTNHLHFDVQVPVDPNGNYWPGSEGRSWHFRDPELFLENYKLGQGIVSIDRITRAYI